MSRTYAVGGFWLALLMVVLFAFPVGAVAQGGGKREITIGYSISMTGKFSDGGKDTNQGYQLWAQEVNKKGGIAVKDLGKRLPVKLVYYDDSSDTNTAIRNYQRLIVRDHVDLLFSPWGSGLNFAITAVTEKYKYPVVLASAGADAIFNRGFKYIFATDLLASKLYDALVDYLGSVRGQIRTVAIAYENFLFTRGLHASLLAKLRRRGIKVVADEQYPLGGQDFTSMLIKIRNARPDAFLLIDIMPSSVYVTRQMAEIGFKPKLYAVNIGPMFRQQFIRKLGKMSEGVMENGFWHPDLPYKGARKFYNMYMAKYNKEPTVNAAYAFVSNQILQQAIERAGTLNREKIAETLHSAKFMTIFGPYEYDRRGVNKHQLSFLTQVQKGKRVIIWPKQVATSAPELPY